MLFKLITSERATQLCRTTASYHLYPRHRKQPAGPGWLLYLHFPAQLPWIRQDHWVQGGCCWPRVSKLSPCPLLMVDIFSSWQRPCYLPGTQKMLPEWCPGKQCRDSAEIYTHPRPQQQVCLAKGNCRGLTLAHPFWQVSWTFQTYCGGYKSLCFRGTSQGSVSHCNSESRTKDQKSFPLCEFRVC